MVSRQGAKDAKNCGWMARAPPESSARGRVLRDASHSPIRHPRESPVPYSIRGRDPCCLGGGPPGCRRRASPLTPRPPLPRGERGDVGPRMRRGRRAPPPPAECGDSSLARPLFGRGKRAARHPEESRGGVKGGFAFLAPLREFCLFPAHLRSTPPPAHPTLDPRVRGDDGGGDSPRGPRLRRPVRVRPPVQPRSRAPPPRRASPPFPSWERGPGGGGGEAPPPPAHPTLDPRVRGDDGWRGFAGDPASAARRTPNPAPAHHTSPRVTPSPLVGEGAGG
jgi:hypothetical protein